MFKALSTAATGLEAQQANVNRIANDMANANTDGYKRSRTEFQDLMYETTKEPGGKLGENTISPVGVQVGSGVKVIADHKEFEQGPARMTHHPYDVMIEGKGFFQVQGTDGDIKYTRSGSFKLDNQRRITNTTGELLIPEMAVPENAMNVNISPNGEVKVLILGEGEKVLGRIQTVSFANEQGLVALGGGQYKRTPASGDAVPGIPNENSYGALLQGALEASNVDVAKNMVDMITTQRTYEANTKVLSTADRMLEAMTGIMR